MKNNALKIQAGTTLYAETFVQDPQEISQKNKAVIYVVEGTSVINLQETTDAEFVFVEKPPKNKQQKRKNTSWIKEVTHQSQKERIKRELPEAIPPKVVYKSNQEKDSLKTGRSFTVAATTLVQVLKKKSFDAAFNRQLRIEFFSQFICLIEKDSDANLLTCLYAKVHNVRPPPFFKHN